MQETGAERGEWTRDFQHGWASCAIFGRSGAAASWMAASAAWMTVSARQARDCRARIHVLDSGGRCTLSRPRACFERFAPCPQLPTAIAIPHI